MSDAEASLRTLLASALKERDQLRVELDSCRASLRRAIEIAVHRREKVVKHIELSRSYQRMMSQDRKDLKRAWSVANAQRERAEKVERRLDDLNEELLMKEETGHE